MLRITTDGRPDVRVVASPLAAAELTLRSGLVDDDDDAPDPVRAVAERVRRAVPPRDLDALRPFAPTIAPGPLPLPEGSVPLSFEDELHLVGPGAAQALADDAALIVGPRWAGPALRPFLADPEPLAVSLMAGLERWWEREMRRAWSRQLAVVDRTRACLGDLAASQGWLHAAGTIHPEVRLEGTSLRVWDGGEQIVHDLGQRRLRLVPVPVAYGATALGVMATADAITITFPVRFRDGGTDDDGRLREVLGRTRAEVLVALRARPGSTSDVALAIGRSAPATSEALTALKVRGFVERRQYGRQVRWFLSPLGDDLLDVLTRRP